MHWIESENKIGLATWLRYVECSHWGLFFTGEFPRWFYPSITENLQIAD